LIVFVSFAEEKQQPTYATSQVNLAADAASETSNLLPKPTADAMSAVQSSFRTANINEDDDEQVAAAVAAAAEAALAAGAQQRVVKTIKKQVVESNKQPFLFLSLTLPPTPLFKDAIEGGSIIPQVLHI
jgi:anti-sigma factor RsiW